MTIKPINVVLKNLLAKVNKQSWYAFISAMLVGFFAHGFVMANRIMYHDDAISIFNLGSTLGSERYTLEVLRRIMELLSHNTSTAWFNGILSLLFLSVFAALVVNVLDIQNEWMAALTAGSLVAFPSVASVFAYMFTAPSYFLALPVITVAVLLAAKQKPLAVIISAICIAFSLGDYQAYSAVYAVLVLLLLLKELVDNNKTMADFWKAFWAYAASFLLGLVLYMVSNKILVYLSGIYNKYNSKNLSMLPKAIVDAYLGFGQAFVSDSIGTAPYRLMRWSYCILLVISIILFVKLFSQMKHKGVVSKIFAIVILLVLPLAMNLVYVLTLEEVEIHSLMVYGLVFMMIIPIAFYEWIKNRTESEKNMKFINIISWILTIAVGCNIFMSCKADNVAYQSAYFSQKQATVYYSTLISRMQQLDGYTDELPVAFVNFAGLVDNNMPDNKEFQVSLTTLELGMKDVTTDYAYKGFLKYQCGFAPVWATDDTIQQLQKQETVKKMACYPNNGSIAIVDGMIVVKFAETMND